MNFASLRTEFGVSNVLLHGVHCRWHRPLLAALVVTAVAGCNSDQRSPLDNVSRRAEPVVSTRMPDEANPAADSIIELILAHYDETSQARLRPLLADRRAIVELPDRPELKALLEDLMIARRRQPDSARVESLLRIR